MIFNLESLANFEFWGYQICQQIVHKITEFHSHFQLKSQWEGGNNAFWQAISSELSEELSTNKK